MTVFSRILQVELNHSYTCCTFKNLKSSKDKHEIQTIVALLWKKGNQGLCADDNENNDDNDASDDTWY